MTPSQVRDDVDRLVTTLFEEQLAIDFRPVLLLGAGRHKVVTWSNDVALYDIIKLASTWEEYLVTLQRRWFSVVLADGAFLQVSYTFDGPNLVKHRLCYFPCPIQFAQTEMAHSTIHGLMESMDARELRRRLRTEGPVRFDYDARAGAPGHPAVHLTISRASCRIPVSYPLSLGHFVRFVFGHFYPAQFSASEDLQEWARGCWDRCLPELTEDTIFIDWKRTL